MVIETERLVLRKVTIDDAEFVLALLNQPSFIRYIGDRGVRNLEDARGYILNRLIASYEQNGYGLYLVEIKESGTPIGISGLVKRDTLPDADIGFAFLPEYWSKGYAVESAVAVMKYARETLKLTRILAITSPDNAASAKLLGKIGLRFERMIKLSDDDDEVKLFRRGLITRLKRVSKQREPNQGKKHVERVRRICLALPEAWEKLSHGEPTFFVKKKVFAMCSINHHNDGHIAVVCPAPLGVQQALIESAPKKYYRPPYVGGAGWIGVELPRVSDKELKMHLREAWRLIAPAKLHASLDV